jgi:hypothetical protein
MAERFISPGVFTRENDRTFLTTGVSAIGAAVIGPTLLGPAFLPVAITSQTDFDEIFGGNSEKTYVPYTVKNYLKNAGIVHVVRVLGTEGWLDSNNRVQGQNDYVKIYVSGSKVGAILAFTSGSDDLSNTVVVQGSGSAFNISSSFGSVSCSFDIASSNHISKVFGTSPFNRNGNSISKEFYCYKVFVSSSRSVSNAIVSSSKGKITFETNKDYSSAYTPWVQSQESIAGGPFNLFRFATISDGTKANMQIKTVIDSIRKPASGSDLYGSFNVIVRDFNDTDNRPIVFETFANCNLNINSPDYILRRIGNKYRVIDSNGKINVYGDFENKSKYIRVDGGDGLENLSNEVVPFGHAAYKNPIKGTDFFNIPTQSYQGAADIYDSRTPWGVIITNVDAKQYFYSLADDVSNNSVGTFNLDSKFGHNSSSLYSGSLSGSTAPSEMLKFVIGFQGGYDGFPENRAIQTSTGITATNVFGFDCSGPATAGTVAYKKAINCISNPDEFDLNLLVIPGILERLHGYVTSHARNKCLDRGDLFYIMDCVGVNDSVQNAVDSVSGIDNNYVATYYPWIAMNDSLIGKNVWVPPSVVMAGTIAFNDRVSAEWYAPAGLNRGGLVEAVDIKSRLTNDERNTLYEGRVNPIATFPGQGYVAWGQKTLQIRSSALDRINVRRLLLALRKFLSSASRYLVFEGNTNQTRNDFLSIANPYLDSVQRRQGVYAYKVIMDETNNTADVIDRNKLVGAIYIQPTRAAEFIELTFNITPTGGTFSE